MCFIVGLRLLCALFSLVTQYIKVDKANRKENNGADSQSDSQSSVSDSPSAAPPPLHRSQEFPRKPLEPFHLHSFPKVRDSLDQCASYQSSPKRPPRQSASVWALHQGALSTNKQRFKSSPRERYCFSSRADFAAHLFLSD